MEKIYEFGTWNVRRLNRAGSLTAATKLLRRYKLGLVGKKKLGGTKGTR
jgi:hypothetical protein